jgi:hypothetical protein
MKHPAIAALSLIVPVWIASLAPAHAGTLAVTFDEPQLVDNDPLLQFYNGGFTFRGIGPGPALGVTFGLNARERTAPGLVGAYTPPGFMQLYSDTAREGEGISTVMNVTEGFVTSLTFSYAAIDSGGELQIFDGLDGTGNVLADILLPITSPQTGPGTFVPDAVSFAGIGASVVFIGGNKQLAIDDIVTTTAIPEPSAWFLLEIGVAVSAVARRSLRRTR